MTVLSPCVRNCCLDSEEMCLGCFRTLREITQWTYLDDVQKQAVIEQTKIRQRAHKARFGEWNKKSS